MNEITVEARVENIPIVTAFIDGELEKADCSPKAQMQIDIAIDEIFANISSYAYLPGTGNATVRFELEEENRTAVIRFLDCGIPFNPLETEEPDITLPAEKRRIGGLGIFMVRKSMDSVAYEYANGQNILTIRKQI